MRSQICFVMHPRDEKEFARLVTSEPGTQFVDGPIWKQPAPPISGDIHTAGNYLMIWNPSETADLMGTHHVNGEKEWWYCKNEYLTIQFLRSGFQFGEPFLFEGRLAVCTAGKNESVFDASSAERIERRFKNLRTHIKRAYRNSTIIWQNLSLPRSKTNPLKPAPNLWGGPHAMHWLEQEPTQRWVQQFREAKARGYILDLLK